MVVNIYFSKFYIPHEISSLTSSNIFAQTILKTIALEVSFKASLKRLTAEVCHWSS
jgi:hypothetical protein